ncbi:hypothetical protein [Morganella sp. EGD-HP17]|uniref:hypothetical protein n=1 Tax=Morganella sp. EGD-HP17 TaxID=1435146 RepID=UPI00040C6C47|nr:hypothetical protein [Morganella sp. EGD-HP17]ETO41223.1 hypothetical protein X965_11285 [Morganella sp. EGD-HP17]
MWVIVAGIFDVFVKRIGFATWRFWLFFWVWVSLYVLLLTATREWLSLLLSDSLLFRHEWWITGISLLPGNTAFCMSTLGAAYSLNFLVNFKRRMFARYKYSLDSK